MEPSVATRLDTAMGYFLSLSKSSTSLWLGVSEWMLLIFGVILVVGLIIEYRAEHASRWMKFGAILVILGVAGELFGDGGIFLFSSHLQSISDAEIAILAKESSQSKERAANLEKETDGLRLQIAEANARAAKAEKEVAQENVRAAKSLEAAEVARKNAEGFQLQIAQANERAAKAELETERLKQRIAGRHLTPEGKKTIAGKLLLYEGQALSVISSNGDSEITGIAMDIIEALNDPHGAKWVLGWTSCLIPGFKVGGIEIEIDALAPDKTVRAANALVLALKGEGLEVHGPSAQHFPENIPQCVGGAVRVGNPTYMGSAITMVITKNP